MHLWHMFLKAYDVSLGMMNKVRNVSWFELSVCNSQCAKHFGSLWLSFCIFSKNCELPKPDTSWKFRVIHLTSYIHGTIMQTGIACKKIPL